MSGWVQRFKSWRLGRRIARGVEPRGRVNAVTIEKMRFRYRLRSWWEEVKLAFRVWWAATKQVGGAIGHQYGTTTPTGRLTAVKIHADGTREDIGLISTKVVTTAGVGFIVDAFQNTVELETMKYHDCGTGVGAEAVGDTTLGTAYGGSRATGTTTEGASANIYQTVGTISFTSTLAITEHGVFSASTSGVLLDRSVFAAINVVNGDSIQFTYELTVPAGS